MRVQIGFTALSGFLFFMSMSNAAFAFKEVAVSEHEPRTQAVEKVMYHDAYLTGNRKIPNLSKKNKPELRAMLSDELSNITDGLIGNGQAGVVDVYAGEQSFMSEDNYTSPEEDGPLGAEKFAGLAVDLGGATMGFGYSWDGEDPGNLDVEREGVVLGLGYGGDNWQVQTSLMTDAKDLTGFRAGKTQATSLSIGAQYVESKKVGYSLSLQANDYTKSSRDNDVRLTFGMKRKF